MTFKKEVRLAGMVPQIAVALHVANEAYNDKGLEMVVTSVNDSKHGENSKHYSGCAFDCRLPSRCDPTPGNPPPIPFYDKVLDKEVADLIRARLPEKDFDVVLETHQEDRFQWHIHVEYDPK